MEGGDGRHISSVLLIGLVSLLAFSGLRDAAVFSLDFVLVELDEQRVVPWLWGLLLCSRHLMKRRR